MVDPPHLGRESEACVDKYNMQCQKVRNGLTERAQLLTNTFNDMK